MNALRMIARCARHQVDIPVGHIEVGGENDIETTTVYVAPADHGRDDVVPLGSEVP